MRINKFLQNAITVAVCAAMTLPYQTIARVQAAQTINGVRVSDDIKNVALEANQTLKGVIVDQQGKPVAGAPVMIGQQGKIIAQMETAADGRYTLTNIKPGIYQVASYAGMQSVRLFDGNAPEDAVQGVVQVIDAEGIVRGQHGDRFAFLKTLLQNPLFWAAIIAAAITIPLVVDDDDAS